MEEHSSRLGFQKDELTTRNSRMLSSDLIIEQLKLRNIGVVGRREDDTIRYWSEVGVYLVGWRTSVMYYEIGWKY